LVRESFSQGLLCAAICAAPSVLDKAGILTGKQYTCFPGVKISEGTPEEATVVRDGNLITSRGVGTAIPFALAIIDYLQGKETADAIADKIVYAGPR
jgi:4-methyl-5(b-hydroxyethyl)-thiazole monophosphate biosynthesis